LKLELFFNWIIPVHGKMFGDPEKEEK
jgi:hypothetical protein